MEWPSVARLGGLLGRAPPGLVGDVPVDRLLEPLGEVGVGRPPAQLALELCAVDGVAAVVTRSVLYPIEIVGVLAHGGEDSAQDIYVAPLPVGSDEIRFPDTPLAEDGAESGGEDF